MVAQIATLGFSLAILGLFVLDREKGARTSWALWIPVLWMLAASSRNLSEWLQFGAPVDPGENVYLEGNPVDRNFMTALMVLALLVLIRRWSRVQTILRANIPVLLFFGYCALSATWSEFSDVSIKRWIRGMGDVLIVLVVLSEEDWLAAVKRFLSRNAFLLLPISLLFIKYYPLLGRQYSRWDGAMSWTGVTNGKNGLGMICWVYGLASVWRFTMAHLDKKTPGRKRLLAAHAILIGLAFFLVQKANSKTSLACLCLAGLVIFLAARPSVRRNAILVHGIVVGVLAVAFCALFLGIGLSALGRDPTLTGRSEIWHLVLGMAANPLVGTGYESFWLGKRLEFMRSIYLNFVNQSHNGYIETYLNLGWLGIALLTGIIVTGYARILRALQRREQSANLRLGYLVATLIYNLTEASFKMTAAVWITFLMSVMIVREKPLVRRKAASSSYRDQNPAEPIASRSDLVQEGA